MDFFVIMLSERYGLSYRAAKQAGLFCKDFYTCLFSELVITANLKKEVRSRHLKEALLYKIIPRADSPVPEKIEEIGATTESEYADFCADELEEKNMLLAYLIKHSRYDMELLDTLQENNAIDLPKLDIYMTEWAQKNNLKINIKR